MPIDPSWNLHGTGYVVRETPVTASGGYDLAPQHNRVFKIQNHSNLNPVNGHPVGYKIMVPPFQPILSHPTSFNARRAEFANRAIYAVAYRDNELFAGGQYTNQSRGGTGVASWAARNDDILDKDLVVYVQFGINHVPRIEDWPVMPCEVLRVGFKPVNFFTGNPALDVPPSEQTFNKSVPLNVPAAAEERQRHDPSGPKAVVGEAGKVCCESKL
jgi:primary-amine oxidase